MSKIPRVVEALDFEKRAYDERCAHAEQWRVQRAQLTRQMRREKSIRLVQNILVAAIFFVPMVGMLALGLVGLVLFPLRFCTAASQPCLNVCWPIYAASSCWTLDAVMLALLVAALFRGHWGSIDWPRTAFTILNG